MASVGGGALPVPGAHGLRWRWRMPVPGAHGLSWRWRMPVSGAHGSADAGAHGLSSFSARDRFVRCGTSTPGLLPDTQSPPPHTHICHQHARHNDLFMNCGSLPLEDAWRNANAAWNSPDTAWRSPDAARHSPAGSMHLTDPPSGRQVLFVAMVACRHLSASLC